MSYGLTQCYMPRGRGDIPAFTTAEVGIQLSDSRGVQGIIDLSTAVKVHADCAQGGISQRPLC